MVRNVIRVVAFAALGLVTMGSICGGTKQFWARVTCAVNRENHGAQEGVRVSFETGKVLQSGKVPWDTKSRFTWSAATLATGWTPSHVCGAFELKYDGRSTEYQEGVRVIAWVDDEGTVYSDTQVFMPMPFLDDTQSVSQLRIDLPPLK
jgi:hypothetical protein